MNKLYTYKMIRKDSDRALASYRQRRFEAKYGRQPNTIGHGHILAAVTFGGFLIHASVIA